MAASAVNLQFALGVESSIEVHRSIKNIATRLGYGKNVTMLSNHKFWYAMHFAFGVVVFHQGCSTVTPLQYGLSFSKGILPVASHTFHIALVEKLYSVLDVVIDSADVNAAKPDPRKRFKKHNTPSKFNHIYGHVIISLMSFCSYGATDVANAILVKNNLEDYQIGVTGKIISVGLQAANNYFVPMSTVDAEYSIVNTVSVATLAVGFWSAFVTGISMPAVAGVVFGTYVAMNVLRAADLGGKATEDFCKYNVQTCDKVGEFVDLKWIQIKNDVHSTVEAICSHMPQVCESLGLIGVSQAL